jgi:hypothetical protein
MPDNLIRTTVRLPADVHAEMIRAMAREQAEKGRKVSMNDWLTDAVEEKIRGKAR